MTTKPLINRLFAKQDGKCFWCQSPMMPPKSFRPGRGRPMPERLATKDHLRDALSASLRETVNRTEIVAACFACNTARGLVRCSLISQHVIKPPKGTRVGTQLGKVCSHE